MIKCKKENNEPITSCLPKAAVTVFDWTNLIKLACRLRAKLGDKMPPSASSKTVVCHAEKRASAQIAHLIFADTQANAEKPKELFFADA